MKILSATDASRLVRIAGNPKLARKERQELLKRMSSPEGRQIVEALLDSRGAPSEAREAAVAIRQWTARQRKRSRSTR